MKKNPMVFTFVSCLVLLFLLFSAGCLPEEPGLDPDPVTYTLTISISGEGTVTPEAGDYEIEESEIITIEAFPAAGWEFSTWEGQVTDPFSKTTLVEMTSDRSVVAVFEKEEGEEDSDFAGGTGTISNPYLIETPEQLDLVREYTESHFRQIAHINLEGFQENEGWDPIPAFSGSYDGDNFKISGLKIHTETGNRIGLFGEIREDGILENIVLEDVYILAESSQYVGGLVGFNRISTIKNCSISGTITGESRVGGLTGTSTGTILDCTSTAIVTGLGDDTGGLVGRSGGDEAKISGSTVEAPGSVLGKGDQTGGLIGFNNGKIENSSARVDVTAEGEYVGGLVGDNYLHGTVSGSFATGEVLGKREFDLRLGGLVGQNRNIIEQSYATGDVFGYGRYVGGLVGYSSAGTIKESFATGDVSGKRWRNDFGGLVGYNRSKIIDCYARGEVIDQTTDHAHTGGLVGYNHSDGEIVNSYSVGKVQGNWHGATGGLVGENRGSVSYSYFDRETSQQEDDEGKGIPKTTEKMKTQSTFEPQWDFEWTWNLDGGYPYLQWE